MQEIMEVDNEMVVRISSREVAKMMGVNHKDLLKKIDGVNEIFKSEKVRPSIYWEEGTYKQNGNGKENREFQITKRGCEFIANKTSGEKGIIFTHRYMERFDEMEKQLQGELVPIKQLEQGMTEMFNKEMERFRKEFPGYIKPLSIDKYQVTKYIKNRLEISKIDKEYELVKERFFIQLGVEKWEDIPVEVLRNSMDLLDECINVIKADRKENQLVWNF